MEDSVAIEENELKKPSIVSAALAGGLSRRSRPLCMAKGVHSNR